MESSFVVLLFAMWILSVCYLIFLILSIVNLVKTRKGQDCKTKGIIFLVLSSICALFPCIYFFIVGFIAFGLILVMDAVIIALFITAGRKTQ